MKLHMIMKGSLSLHQSDIQNNQDALLCLVLLPAVVLLNNTFSYCLFIFPHINSQDSLEALGKLDVKTDQALQVFSHFYF